VLSLLPVSRDTLYCSMKLEPGGRPGGEVKATPLFVMIVLIAGGLGLMLRGYAEDRRRGID
jgi:hypothetical protein